MAYIRKTVCLSVAPSGSRLARFHSQKGEPPRDATQSGPNKPRGHETTRQYIIPHGSDAVLRILDDEFRGVNDYDDHHAAYQRAFARIRAELGKEVTQEWDEE
jgi:hypothetical protein